MRSKNLTALALSQKICALAPSSAQFLARACAHTHAQNVLSAAQFCAHVRMVSNVQQANDISVYNSFSRAILYLYFKNNLSFTTWRSNYGNLGVFISLKREKMAPF